MQGNQSLTLNVMFTGKCRNDQTCYQKTCCSNFFVAFNVSPFNVPETMALKQIYLYV